MLPGTEITLTTEKSGASAGGTQRWRYEGGLREYLLSSLADDPILPPFESSGFAAADDPTFAWTYSGFITGQNAGNVTITGGASCSRTSGESVAGSPYTITCTPGDLSAANYSFATGSTGWSLT